MKGDIGDELITPEEFCPYLLKKSRNEKLKEIDYEYKRAEEEITRNCS